MEIVAAAEALLRERPFRELTVDEIMRRTGLSRPSFYVYFKDRHELVLRVVGHLRAELMGVADVWLGSLTGGPDSLRSAIKEVVVVYRQHSPVLRALADAASDDPEVETAYGDLIRSFISVAAERIAQDDHIAPGMDAVETAKALVWMTERYLYHATGPNATASSDAGEPLARIWTRAIYPTSP